MARTKDETLREITETYLRTLNQAKPPGPATIQADILDATQLQFQLENQNRPKGSLWRIPDKLTPAQIADVLMALYPIVNIAYGGLSADPQYDVLSMYQADGPDEGIYIWNSKVFSQLIHQYCYTISEKGEAEVMKRLKDMAPRRVREDDRDLIAVNNGIFDYKAKKLMPFSPELIFTSKARVDYVPHAQNVTIYNPADGTHWDIESWMADLSDDPAVVELLWQIVGAVIRPLVPWNKAVWFYSSKGNNGKGTLCQLMREVCGEGQCASISLNDLGKDFMLEPLLKASALIQDENDVGTFIDKAANLKAIITADKLLVNRKHQTAVAFRFRGMMIQCLNEPPRIKDKSDSFFRRQIFVPFDKCFTGAERKYIKTDYIHRKEVLQYVLKRVLHMDYYELSEPEACKLALDEYKEYSDPVRQFVAEILPECKWDLLPYPFIYDLYKAWFARNVPAGTPEGRNRFIADIKNLLANSPEWDTTKKKSRTGTKMDKAEPLIVEYDLKSWMNPCYRGMDADKLCHPGLKEFYQGIERRRTGIATVPQNSDPAA